MHLPIISQWQKYRLPLKRIRPVQILKRHAELDYYWWLWSSFASVTRWKVSRGHMMTSRDKYAFLPISFDRIEIETWDRHQWVHFGQVHHVIRNMICLCHFVFIPFMPFRWTRVKFRSNFVADLTMLKIYYSIRPDEANKMVLICTSCFKSIKEILWKNVLFQAKYLFLSGLHNDIWVR